MRLLRRPGEVNLSYVAAEQNFEPHSFTVSKDNNLNKKQGWTYIDRFTH